MKQYRKKPVAIEAASYTEFMELLEGKLVEVEVRVKMLNRKK